MDTEEETGGLGRTLRIHSTDMENRRGDTEGMERGTRGDGLRDEERTLHRYFNSSGACDTLVFSRQTSLFCLESFLCVLREKNH